MKREVKPQPKREEHYWLNGVEVTLSELAAKVRACGGLAAKGKGSK